MGVWAAKKIVGSFIWARCSKGPFEVGTIGATLPRKEILTKKGIYLLTILGRTRNLSNRHMHDCRTLEINSHILKL